jgi:hypothetical protein
VEPQPEFILFLSGLWLFGVQRLRTSALAFSRRVQVHILSDGVENGCEVPSVSPVYVGLQAVRVVPGVRHDGQPGLGPRWTLVAERDPDAPSQGAADERTGNDV